MLNYIHKLKPYLPFLIFFIISVVLRLININDALFFTWDQGRDFFAIKQIVDGNITLIGPTTGLPGLFLGPLWYYIGIPGYILGQGNPYFFTLWYIFITLSSLPLFWMMGKALFKNRHLAIVCAYALSLVPGGVWGTIRVWNPLIAIPLMTAAFLALVKARKSRLFLGLGFFLMGLTLHSEFAYAIFFCTTMVLLVPWIRQKFSFKDIVIAVTAVGITLLPQIVFEVRHDFIMSRTMIATATDPDAEHIAWDYHLSRRPMKLIEATSKLVTGGDQHPGLVFSIIVASWIIASKSILSSRKKSSTIS